MLPSVRSRRLAVALAIFAPVALGAQGSPFDALRFRNIGPAALGGRMSDVEALPNDPSTVYAAAASGGLWKSTNKGTTWAPIFDHQSSSSLGVVAIFARDPNLVWVGTGEQNNRQSSTWGDGGYRSTDGGKTWSHLGLEASAHIARIRLHPTNANVAWVAALGNLWKPNAERGVFKTTDGGGT